MMAGARKKRRRSGGYYMNWEGWYHDRYGCRRWFKGFRTKGQTLEIAYSLEVKERKAKLLGQCQEIVENLDAFYVLDLYLEWGRAQGGRGGRPWSKPHFRMRKNQLGFFIEELRIKWMSDFYGSLNRVECALGVLRKRKLAPKTVHSYAESVRAFCRWCVERDYLERNPLERLKGGSTRAVLKRRQFTEEEISRIFSVAPASRRLTYIVALCSGFRAGELGSLKVADFDFDGGFLILRGENSKNGKEAIQPIAKAVVRELEVAVRGRKSSELLLYVPSHTARDLDIDLKAAGVEKVTVSGTVVFHSFRITYITWLSEMSSHPKEIQELARHSTSQLTFDVYARTTAERLRERVEGLGGRASLT